MWKLQKVAKHNSKQSGWLQCMSVYALAPLDDSLIGPASPSSSYAPVAFVGRVGFREEAAKTVIGRWLGPATTGHRRSRVLFPQAKPPRWPFLAATTSWVGASPWLRTFRQEIIISMTERKTEVIIYMAESETVYNLHGLTCLSNNDRTINM
jgi:hypothetical protein